MSVRALPPVFTSLLITLLAAPAAAARAIQEEEAVGQGLMDRVDGWMAKVNEKMASVFFYPVPVPGTEGDVPLAVLILVSGAIFFTLYMGLVQFRLFGHAVQVTRGRYDNPADQGEVSHFQALTAALSATVGLGNIAGVAIAMMVGGPGATFWMIIAGLLGMASKFTECTLGQMYREVRPDGRVMGGAMFYLSKGLKEMGIAPVGKVLAVFFCIVCIGASFGGGNTFQVSQSLGLLKGTFPVLETYPYIYGLIMMALVAVVILGGIRRIAATAEKIVPIMCSIYVLSCIAILVLNFTHIPAALGDIFGGAFSPEAAFGGFLGVLVQGFRRAAFSNEAGIGSAAIAHSAAKTEYPVREGIVALLEPFIDTVVVCTMTALVIVITNSYNDPQYASYIEALEGAALTNAAMCAQLGAWFEYVLAVAVMLFAYSTIISWSYYGERCWSYLFGDGSSVIYKLLFIVFVGVGSIVTAANILEFGDLLIFGMVFPNIIGVVLLSGRVRRHLTVYLEKLRANQFQTFK